MSRTFVVALLFFNEFLLDLDLFLYSELAEIVYVHGRAPVFWHYALLWLKEAVTW